MLLWVRNPDPARGMSHSLRLGFAALPSEVEAAVILLGDQPRVPVEHLHALVAARGDRPLVASDYSGLLAPPVLVERSHFDLLSAPRGDVGLREILRGPGGAVASVPAGAAIDIDRPEDLDEVTHPDRRG
jgi:molybdenum cofactor cytidylyltransferase